MNEYNAGDVLKRNDGTSGVIVQAHAESRHPLQNINYLRVEWEDGTGFEGSEYQLKLLIERD